MTTMGCCGRRTTAMGLLEMADAYPPSHPRGAWARKKLAFSVVADKAKQAGNRAAYDRAMAGLRMLGDGPSTGYHGAAPAPTAADAAAATRAFQTLVTQTQARVSADLTMASSYINIVLAAAQIGTGLGAALCNGCDRTGIDAVNLVISIVRGVITPGSSLMVPTLSVDTLNGLVSFCVFKDAIKGSLQAAFGVGIAAASASRDAQAVSALTTIQGFLTNLIDAICNIPQVQMAIAALTAPPATTEPPPTPTAPATHTSRCWNGTTTTQTWDPATQRWGAPTPACPPQPPAAGLETGAGGCVTGVRGGGPGAYNMIAPSGVRTATGAVLPGTAGAKSCARCSSPSTYIPGVTDSQGFWATPPGCMAPNGRVVNSPRTGPCPRGTSRGSDGVCAGAPGGGGGGGGGLVFVGAAAIAAKLLGFF